MLVILATAVGRPMINPIEGARTLIWYQPAKSVVIAQIYGGGGNSGALWRHDFIELYNAGGTTVDLSGWSLHYASATGTTWQ
ncbi:MAG: lamin tail domain-containing protein, partial [Acidobacteria bacterium]|nr:lamin tail domain-containing protein [Acidobacteriota bacterium]